MKFKTMLILSMLLMPGCDAEESTNTTIPSSCTVDDSEKDFATLFCDDGTAAIINHGQDGADGINGVDGIDGADGNDGIDGTNGVDGIDGVNSNCFVTDNNDNTYAIKCSDGTSITFSDGIDGVDGKDGIDGQDGADGKDGDICTILDNEDGTITIDCIDKKPIILTAQIILPEEEIAVHWSFDNDDIEVDTGEGSLYFGTNLSSPNFVGGNSGRAITFSNWGLDPENIDENRYMEIVTNFENFEKISFSFQANRSSSGPKKFQIYYSLGEGFEMLPNSTTEVLSEQWEEYTFDLSFLDIGNLDFYLRIYGFDASSTVGTWRLDNLTFKGFL
jgi:hypothetical protein